MDLQTAQPGVLVPGAGGCRPILYRPLADVSPQVLLVIQRRTSGAVPRAAQDLHEAFVRRAREVSREESARRA